MLSFFWLSLCFDVQLKAVLSTFDSFLRHSTNQAIHFTLFSFSSLFCFSLFILLPVLKIPLSAAESIIIISPYHLSIFLPVALAYVFQLFLFINPAARFPNFTTTKPTRFHCPTPRLPTDRLQNPPGGGAVYYAA